MAPFILALAVIAAPAHPSLASAGCARARHAISRGSIIGAEDLTAAECSDAHPASPFIYDDAVRAVRTARMLNEGDLVPALPRSILPQVVPGQPIRMAVQVGAVTLNRTVYALQPGHPGERLFVRASDGHVFAIHLPEVQP